MTHATQNANSKLSMPRILRHHNLHNSLGRKRPRINIIHGN